MTDIKAIIDVHNQKPETIESLRARVAELEESNVQLTAMLNNELGGTTFMGEPVVAQSALKASQGEPVAFQFGKDFCAIANFWPPENVGDTTVRPLYTSAPTIPEGWKLVPIEPTGKMLWAGVETYSSSWDIYTSMLAAAPEYKIESNLSTQKKWGE